jgi:hypothetical protein
MANNKKNEGEIAEGVSGIRSEMMNNEGETAEGESRKANEENADNMENTGVTPEGSSAISTHYVEEYPSNMGATGLPPRDDNEDKNES